jgi:hypothetical protein
MQQSVDAMRVALRVLDAFARRCHSDRADVQELRRLAPPMEYISINEMACTVVEEALKRHRRTRQQSVQRE